MLLSSTIYTKLDELTLIIERLQRLEQGDAIYSSARYILERKGVSASERREFSGNIYRITERGETLTIFHSKSIEPLYQATVSEGILEISQFNMTPSDKKALQNYAQYLQRLELKLNKGPQLGR